MVMVMQGHHPTAPPPYCSQEEVRVPGCSTFCPEVWRTVRTEFQIARPLAYSVFMDGNQQRYHELLDFKIVKALAELVRTYGVTAAFTVAQVEALNHFCMTPGDWMNLDRQDPVWFLERLMRRCNKQDEASNIDPADESDVSAADPSQSTNPISGAMLLETLQAVVSGFPSGSDTGGNSTQSVNVTTLLMLMEGLRPSNSCFSQENSTTQQDLPYCAPNQGTVAFGFTKVPRLSSLRFSVAQTVSGVGSIEWTGLSVKLDINCYTHNFCATSAMVYL
ncbi:olfactory receptor [Cricetulus griseus]|uniref:Olfactory receptor n=1 Tax=Cricetulus griseus TaxID=10029 RepID=A0A061I4Z5_CRIGR|nr:olfactory receptor [Cricetulus griseus]